TLVVRVDVVGPLGANNSEFRFQIDFGEPQKIGRQLLSLADQTVEPGTKGIPTADVSLRLSFDSQGPHFSGLPGLADRSGVDPTAGEIVFVASVDEILAQASRIGNIGVASFSDLALSSDGRLYGSLGFGGGGRIVRIDPTTAQRTDVGFSGFSAVPALDFAPPGTQFAGTLFGTGAAG